MKDRHGLFPLLAGLTLAGVGYGLRQLKPGTLDLPRPTTRPRLPDFRDHRDIARQTRDGLATVMPDNVLDSFGRTFIILGAGLIAMRALDALVDDNDALF